MERLRVEIRDMRSGDESALFYLAEETLHELASCFGHEERYRADELMDLFARARVYVAEAGDEIAGYVVVEREGDTLALRCLCVSPAYEARAVAHQLVDWVEGVAFNQHVARLSALVPADDRASQHLYRGHEFVPVPAADRPQTIVMEKRLPLN